MKYLIDLHTHTNVNPHAYSTLGENVREAKKKGMKIIAITNHGPALPDSPHWWSLRNLRALPDEIDGVRILKGVEANIIDEDGNIDLNQNIYEIMDIILVGFHPVAGYPDGKDKDKNTRTMINVIKSQRIDIIAHPGNPKFPIDYEEVIKVATKYNVAIELNNSSFKGSREGSEENCKSIMSIAKKYGCYLSLGSDAHFSHSVGDLDVVGELLEKISYPKELILNSDVKTLNSFLSLRKELKPKEIPDNI
ncbi:phosphatase [uncultured Ilyobacter sp.]|uniref:phosphatase n=1 Tax=uncultured Ilyobacter sp. TaxID=544433 RepID=UPI0029C8B7D3|nr:phosphatase [uncultured Ilyobacter sp.]